MFFLIVFACCLADQIDIYVDGQRYQGMEEYRKKLNEPTGEAKSGGGNENNAPNQEKIETTQEKGNLQEIKAMIDDLIKKIPQIELDSIPKEEIQTEDLDLRKPTSMENRSKPKDASRKATMGVEDFRKMIMKGMAEQQKLSPSSPTSDKAPADSDFEVHPENQKDPYVDVDPFWLFDENTVK